MKRATAPGKRWGVFRHKVIKRWYLQFGHWILWVGGDRPKTRTR